MSGLIVVQGQRRSFSHRAKATVPRADVASEHKSGGPVRPAFKNVRAARFLANCVKIQAFDQLQNMILICRISKADL
jgi:hypothetical protein